MPKQNDPTPKTGAYRRDRANKSSTTGKNAGGSIVGRITARLWRKKDGWSNPGRRD